MGAREIQKPRIPAILWEIGSIFSENLNADLSFPCKFYVLILFVYVYFLYYLSVNGNCFDFAGVSFNKITDYLRIFEKNAYFILS